MTINPDSEKHQVFREMLVLLGVRVEAEYFSEGSTITLEGLKALQNRLNEYEQRVQSVKQQIEDAHEDMQNL